MYHINGLFAISSSWILLSLLEKSDSVRYEHHHLHKPLPIRSSRFLTLTSPSNHLPSFFLFLSSKSTTLLSRKIAARLHPR